MDKLDAERRSANMSRIRSKDMAPELAVRRLVHSLGFRFRLHRRDLPGRPDIVLPKHRKIVFVHGCFWHLHTACREGRIPSSRREYWEPKLTRNRARDAAHLVALRAAGWKCLVVWECETSDLTTLLAKLRRFLEPPTNVAELNPTH
jgi:DNA mismatch endonuclease (patch repair protein)